MEHIHNCETPFYSDCPACRIEKAAPDLLEAYKELLALWWDAKVTCRKPQCGVCKQNRKFHKKFSDIIAEAEKP